MRRGAVLALLVGVGACGFEPIPPDEQPRMFPEERPQPAFPAFPSFVENNVRLRDNTPDGGDDVDMSTPVLSDVPCNEAWTVVVKSESSCNPRQVEELEAGLPAPKSLALARTALGEVAVAYDKLLDAQYGVLHIKSFPSATMPLSKTLDVIGDNPETITGTRVALTTAGGETFHMAYLVTSAASNYVRYRKLNTNGVLSSTETPIGTLSGKTELGLLVSSLGDVTLISFEGSSRKLEERTRSSTNQTWSAPLLIHQTLSSSAPGSGNLSVQLGPLGDPEVAFSSAFDSYISLPMWNQRRGLVWASAQYLETPVNVLSGLSMSLAIFEETRFAAYYQLDEINSKLALRVAKYGVDDNGLMGTVAFDGVDNLKADLLSAGVSIATAPDGLLHIAYYEPTATSARLMYRRQARFGDQIVWSVDTIDPDTGVAANGNLVKILVDSNSRPHIAYYSAKNMKMLYATRWDR